MTDKGTRASSVLQLLLDLGIDDRLACRTVAPIIDWFDGMSPGLAEAVLPTLHAEILAVCPCGGSGQGGPGCECDPIFARKAHR